MKRFVLALVVTVGLCSLGSGQSAKDTSTPKAPAVATEKPAEPSVKELQGELAMSKQLVTALQRRLKSTDEERVEAQSRLVLMRDEIARLNEELETARTKNPK